MAKEGKPQNIMDALTGNPEFGRVVREQRPQSITLVRKIARGEYVPGTSQQVPVTASSEPTFLEKARAGTAREEREYINRMRRMGNLPEE